MVHPKHNGTSFHPRIKLEIKDKIVEDLAKGINRKKIANDYSVSQTLITEQKTAMPLFCYHPKKD